MKLWLMAALFGTVAVSGFADVIEVGSIPITGSGSYSCLANPTDGGEFCNFSVSFSGSAGSDTVSFQAFGSNSTGYPGPYGIGGPVTAFSGGGSTFLLAPGLLGGGSIDGVVSNQVLGNGVPPIGVFGIACCVSGNEFFEIFDPTSGNLLAIATLNGSIITTSYSSTIHPIGGGADISGAFMIVPVPEANSAGLMLIGAGVFGVCCGFRGVRRRAV